MVGPVAVAQAKETVDANRHMLLAADFTCRPKRPIGLFSKHVLVGIAHDLARNGTFRICETSDVA